MTAVVVYHFGGGASSWLPGGFLGVDLFFVLSGYLITGLLLAEHRRRGRIDLAAFWSRRVRRLLPALTVMLLVVCAWIWWATPLESFPARRSDLLWTVGDLANWRFLEWDDYFAGYTAASPLRHTWSLSVEEQFYVVWPLLLVGLLRTRRHRAPLPVAVIGIALSAAAMAMTFDPLTPSRAYYATQGRAQELFVGVALAVLLARRRPPTATATTLHAGRNHSLVMISAVAGISLAAAFWWMSDRQAFYYRGGALLFSVAVATSIAVVELRPHGRTARCLSWRPAVGLGRISYGVYLWHWPIVLMIAVPDAGSPTQTFWRQAQRVVATGLLAALSYRFVEQPIQHDRRWLTSKRRVLAATLTSTALVVAVALLATSLPGTLDSQLSIAGDRQCPGERPDLLLVCIAPQGADPVANPPRLAVLGDSTARALGPGLDDWAANAGATWIEAAWKRCTPIELIVIPSNLSEPDAPASTCYSQAPKLIRELLATYRPKTVLVAEFWDSYQPLLVDGRHIPAGSAAHNEALRTGYQNLVAEIARYGGHTVFLELPPPGLSIGRQLAVGRPAARARPTGNGRAARLYNGVVRGVVQNSAGMASMVSLTDVICPGGTCSAVRGDTLLRGDGVHYSRTFSRELVPILMQRIGLVIGSQTKGVGR